MDPLHQLYELFDAEMMQRVAKPPLRPEIDTNAVDTPQGGDMHHPVIQKRNEVDAARESGMDAVQAHQSVHGDTDLSNVDSKAQLAATIGRMEADSATGGLKIDKDGEFKSILAVDAEIEANMDQVTRNDLRTPMQQQIPDDQQTPEEEVAESLDSQVEIDYNDDVAYLQKYGRA